ncbi:hypothetical protein FH972_025117 [Carpinus fangiana]|uniref:Uncharacterized protein n=1 Tax=Carpinus fangiana TaxID=176857 RepID=A0A5N6L030_9ROSI|nr:hypothetical protein FH972_025117 [Carpinus fangiana]
MASAPDDIDALPPLATRPTYTTEEVQEYLEHIAMPPSARHTTITHLTPAQQLEHLTLLLHRTLAAVPFENLSLHYSVHKTMLLSPTLLFDKIVRGRADAGPSLPHTRRGGYCMQNNTLLATVLRSLGYAITSVGARVAAPNGLFGGWSHHANLVRLGDTAYLLDIGFGPNGPTLPLPLAHGVAHAHLGDAQQRLRYTRLAQHTDAASRAWVYEHRVARDGPWTTVYSFVETEFLPPDYGIMSLATATRRDTFFTYEVVCTRFTLDAETGELDGCLILGTGLKWRRRGENKVIVERFKNEAERLKALDEWFQIRFPEEDARGIAGMVSEIKEESA